MGGVLAEQRADKNHERARISFSRRTPDSTVFLQDRQKCGRLESQGYNAGNEQQEF
jgi:hypothetical protein